MYPAPAVKDLLLVGGGHSHVQVLRRFGMRPEPGVRLTIVAREVHTPYSGMLPGHIGGAYDWDDIHIDLAKLARFAGARLIGDEVTAIDLDDRHALMDGRPPLRFDIVSINVGGTPGSDITASDGMVCVKPIGQFLPRWKGIVEQITAASEALRLTVVGGGPGSVELALAISQKYRSKVKITLVTADPDILVEHPTAVRETMRTALTACNVDTLPGFRVKEVQRRNVVSEASDRLGHDHVLWVTGVDAPRWPGASGLTTDLAGFIEVNAYLQSVSHPFVFAAGDVVSLQGQSRPKSGVFAVREGPVLAHNLRRFALDQGLRSYRAQKHALALMSMADGRAVASRGRWHATGRWLWTWKDWIDRRFMKRFQQLPQMETSEPDLAPALQADAPATMRCGGCGAKLGADILNRVLARLTPQSSPVLLQGIGDDAAIIQWSQAKIVTSCDGFRAMIDDPYRFGRIAAHHALNDLFAMGAAPSYALAIVTIPLMADVLMEEDLFQVMSGAIEVLNEHGAVLAGGHSGEGAELTIGFAVTGGLTMNALSKGGLVAGQGLILTKAIGTGAILAGAMQGKTRADDLMATIDAMDTSNGRAADILRDHGATACTDVTGFGLIGHLGEMLRASSMGVRLNAADVPRLPSAQELLAAGVQSSLQANNEQALLDFEIRGGSPASPSVRLLADPQTAGGLLAGIPADACDDCVEALRADGYADAVVIGSVQTEARVVEGV